MTSRLAFTVIPTSCSFIWSRGLKLSIWGLTNVTTSEPYQPYLLNSVTKSPQGFRSFEESRQRRIILFEESNPLICSSFKMDAITIKRVTFVKILVQIRTNIASITLQKLLSSFRACTQFQTSFSWACKSLVLDFPKKWLWSVLSALPYFLGR